MEYLIFSVGDPFIFFDNPIHLNDIQPVNEDSNFWIKGDVFLSLRNQSMILLYRHSTNKIIWKGVGHTYYQHDVDILNQIMYEAFRNLLDNRPGPVHLDLPKDILEGIKNNSKKVEIRRIEKIKFPQNAENDEKTRDFRCTFWRAKRARKCYVIVNWCIE